VLLHEHLDHAAQLVRAVVTWGFTFRLREYLRGSIWVLPLLGTIAGVILGSLSLILDRSVSVPAFWQYSPSTASTVLSAIVGSTAALIGFIVTVTVLVVQMATGTFSARYMRLWYRDRMLKAALTLLIGTLAFSFQLLRRVESSFVPNLGVTVAGALLLASLLVFMLYLDRVLHNMRPVAVAALVAKAGRRAFESAVQAAASPDAPDFMGGRYDPGREPVLRVRSPRAGSVQAIDGVGLVRWARRHRCLLVLPHVVGDFLPVGATLIAVYGDPPERSERALSGMVALGTERTIEQDPAFAIRIMVDIANLALSPAVNDPTTAVQVLDHLGEMLRMIGSTDLAGESTRKGAPSAGSVVIHARRWEDFLELGVTEIREYGATGIQVNRRLRAMLEELRETVRPEYRPAVEDELTRLAASVASAWADSPDLDRALAADRQGIGGPPEPGDR
jgi:uncharacterized membrane protein